MRTIFFEEGFRLNTLKQGNRGAEVELMQTGLRRAGFLNSAPDGIFGNDTATAVKAFQRDVGLTADGIVGNNTWNSLLPWIKGYMTYTVQNGNTYYSLARRFGVTAAEIEAANPTVNADRLTVGQKITVPLAADTVPTDIRWTSELMTLITDGLVRRYPFIRLRSIGQSVMGNTLYLFAIGNGRRTVCYNASHHANEWITTPLLMKFLEQYARAYVNNKNIGSSSAASLFNNYTLYLVPMVNPDGINLVNGVIPTENTYYKQAVKYAQNYPSVSFPSGWKANINGVDLNLNYPANWYLARSIKFAQGYTSPAPRDYVGSAPLSQPESYAMYRLTVNSIFLLTLSYHTQGKIIYWKYDNYLPANSYEIAQKMSAVSGYSVEDTPYASGNAGYKDWFIQTYNRPGYTIEAGKGTNPLPVSQFDEIYKDNLGILLLGMTSV